MIVRKWKCHTASKWF